MKFIFDSHTVKTMCVLVYLSLFRSQRRIFSEFKRPFCLSVFNQLFNKVLNCCLRTKNDVIVLLASGPGGHMLVPSRSDSRSTLASITPIIEAEEWRYFCAELGVSPTKDTFKKAHRFLNTSNMLSRIMAKLQSKWRNAGHFEPSNDQRARGGSRCGRIEARSTVTFFALKKK